MSLAKPPQLQKQPLLSAMRSPIKVKKLYGSAIAYLS